MWSYIALGNLIAHQTEIGFSIPVISSLVLVRLFLFSARLSVVFINVTFLNTLLFIVSAECWYFWLLKKEFDRWRPEIRNILNFDLPNWSSVWFFYNLNFKRVRIKSISSSTVPSSPLARRVFMPTSFSINTNKMLELFVLFKICQELWSTYRSFSFN